MAGYTCTRTTFFFDARTFLIERIVVVVVVIAVANVGRADCFKNKTFYSYTTITATITNVRPRVLNIRELYKIQNIAGGMHVVRTARRRRRAEEWGRRILLDGGEGAGILYRRHTPGVTL